MKDRRQRARQVRQRKVAALAAYSRKHAVSNNTIPNFPQGKVYNNGNGEWKTPKEGFPQPKTLKKKYKKKYYCMDGSIRKIISHASDWEQFEDRTFRPKGRAWYMEELVKHKTARWEKKNPCPVKEDQNPPDIFEQEYLIPWKAKRDLSIERIRDFVVSIYDKLPLTGRFEKSDNKFVEEPVAEIKDINGEGHHINELDPKKSKLLKVAQKVTNKTKEKHHNLVCTNLKDHKRQKGRIILPKAA